jgi:hypothetical protein
MHKNFIPYQIDYIINNKKYCVFKYSYSPYQAMCSKSKATLLLVGGIAAIGKTYFIATESLKRIMLYPNYKITIYREMNKAINVQGGLFDTCKKIIDDQQLTQKKIIKISRHTIINTLNNSSIKFDHLDINRPKEVQNTIKGTQVSLFCIDETDQIDIQALFYLFRAINRTEYVGQIITTCNPIDDRNNSMAPLFKLFLKNEILNNKIVFLPDMNKCNKKHYFDTNIATNEMRLLNIQDAIIFTQDLIKKSNDFEKDGIYISDIVREIQEYLSKYQNNDVFSFDEISKFLENKILEYKNKKKLIKHLKSEEKSNVQTNITATIVSNEAILKFLNKWLGQYLTIQFCPGTKEDRNNMFGTQYEASLKTMNFHNRGNIGEIDGTWFSKDGSSYIFKTNMINYISLAVKHEVVETYINYKTYHTESSNIPYFYQDKISNNNKSNADIKYKIILYFVTYDLAFTESKDSDYTVACLWGINIHKQLILLNFIRFKANCSDAEEIIIEFIARYEQIIDYIFTERVSSVLSSNSRIQKEFPKIKFETNKYSHCSKIKKSEYAIEASRAIHSQLIKDNNLYPVLFNSNIPNLKEFEDEVFGFNIKDMKLKHDDTVDNLVHALIFAKCLLLNSSAHLIISNPKVLENDYDVN